MAVAAVVGGRGVGRVGQPGGVCYAIAGHVHRVVLQTRTSLVVLPGPGNLEVRADLGFRKRTHGRSWGAGIDGVEDLRRLDGLVQVEHDVGPVLDDGARSQILLGLHGERHPAITFGWGLVGRQEAEEWIFRQLTGDRIQRLEEPSQNTCLWVERRLDLHLQRRQFPVVGASDGVIGGCLELLLTCGNGDGLTAEGYRPKRHGTPVERRAQLIRDGHFLSGSGGLFRVVLEEHGVWQ